MYVWTYVGMYVCMYLCMYVCMYVRMDLCMDLCIYVWMYVCITFLINKFGSVDNLTNFFNETVLSTVLHFLVEAVWEILQACFLGRDIFYIMINLLLRATFIFTAVIEINFKK